MGRRKSQFLALRLCISRLSWVILNLITMTRAPAAKCNHSSLLLTTSRHAKEIGYQRPKKLQRLAAVNTAKANQRNPSAKENSATFPAPLVLPGDDLAEDPEYPAQSVQEWASDEDRNEVTTERNVVYVVPPPQIDAGVDFLHKWSTPRSRREHQRQTPHPSVHDVRGYLAAFFHGLPTKGLPQTTLHFMPWEESRKPSTSRKPKYLGLRLGEECVRIRIRACPDGVYEGQLNLDDLLDAAISMLPSDAYALLLLVDYDLYEDDEDSFVCGRAYGGSRVAVVSTARYNPDLDDMQSVERDHAWPASHCEDYVSLCCSSLQPSKRPKKSNATETKRRPDSTHPLESTSSPMAAAISVYHTLSETEPSLSSLSALWLGRICRTASHELGHCFGLDHCVYYACAMQGTGSISEDVRQPPYLCPVDSAKLVRATGTTAVSRYAALLAFCERSGNKNSIFFAPFAAWIRAIPDELKC